jgi:hypothetical protein
MPTKETSKQPGEQFVVTEGGVRRDGATFPDEQAAQAEVEKRKQKLQEAGGAAPAPKVEVKRQIFG